MSPIIIFCLGVIVGDTIALIAISLLNAAYNADKKAKKDEKDKKK